MTKPAGEREDPRGGAQEPEDVSRTHSESEEATFPARSRRWGEGEILLGDYRVEALLGEGGMGSVHRVRSGASGLPFAVKRIRSELLQQPSHRRAFLQELQTWSDLPEHPHIVSFRFFRHLGEEFLLFSDYVPGGSLRDRITSGFAGDLEEILDAALQIAWGLAAAHRQGVVHQDVKPGNILVSDQGLVKITDFGLARAARCIREHEEEPLSIHRAPTVSWSGGTPAYWSPEQARRQSLTTATDIWSWGACLLHMLLGERTWITGTLVPQVLECLQAGDALAEGIPVPHPRLLEILERCFQAEPTSRWSDLEDAATALQDTYREILGREPGRERPELPTNPASARFDRRTHWGARWEDPLPFLQRALQAVGEDPRSAPERLLPYPGTQRGGTLADLAAFEEARSILQPLIQAGDARLQADLMDILAEEALILGSLGDLSGGISLYHRALHTFRSRDDDQQDPEMLHRLALLIARLGLTQYQAGDVDGAARSLREAEQAFLRLLKTRPDDVLHSERAGVGNNLSLVLRAQGDLEGSMQALRRSRDAYADLAERRPDPLTEKNLALATNNLGRALHLLGRSGEALEEYQRAAAIYRRRARDGDDLAANELAGVELNRGLTLAATGEWEAAVKALEKAREIRRELLEQGRPDLVHPLAVVEYNLGNTLRLGGDPRAALEPLESARSACTHLVHREGRKELIPHLILMEISFGQACVHLDAIHPAREALRRGRELLKVLRQTGDTALPADDLEQKLDELARALDS